MVSILGMRLELELTRKNRSNVNVRKVEERGILKKEEGICIFSAAIQMFSAGGLHI